MPHSQHTRRQLLKLTGSLAAVGLAGCTSRSDGPAGDGGTETPPGTEDDHHEETDDHGTEAHHEETDEHGGEADHQETDEHGGEADHQETDEHGHNHDEGTPEAPAAAAEVAMRTADDGQHFAPHMTWVEVGATVTWHAESGTHDTVAYHPDNDRPQRIPDGGTPWQSDLLAEGGSFEHTFEEAGVYDYFCTPHEGVGMVGTVIVGEPDAHGQPALAEPQDSLPEGASAELADLGTMVKETLGHTH
jgi:plastocyanin